MFHVQFKGSASGNMGSNRAFPQEQSTGRLVFLLRNFTVGTNNIGFTVFLMCTADECIIIETTI